MHPSLARKLIRSCGIPASTPPRCSCRPFEQAAPRYSRAQPDSWAQSESRARPYSRTPSYSRAHQVPLYCPICWGFVEYALVASLYSLLGLSLILFSCYFCLRMLGLCLVCLCVPTPMNPGKPQKTIQSPKRLYKAPKH